jgi:NAD(P)-dependent dehydrogenase (short-subunit alcohol dehydrogenase family)
VKSVVVTGASSGIGWGIARTLTSKGWHVFGSVRKQDDADRLSEALGAAVTPLQFDVEDEAGVRAGAETVRRHLNGETLAGLVNNAGIAIPGPVLHQSLAAYRAQIDVNLIGAYVASQAFIPLLGADRSLSGPPGRIVNITSLGGKIGAPLLAGYCSSKHGLEGLSECMRREMMLYGIDVVIVGPGAVKTPIWDKAQSKDMPDYADTDYGAAMKVMEGGARDGLDVERVGALVHRALTTRRPRTRYALAPNYLLDWVAPTSLPKRLVDRVFAWRLGIGRRRG